MSGAATCDQKSGGASCQGKSGFAKCCPCCTDIYIQFHLASDTEGCNHNVKLTSTDQLHWSGMDVLRGSWTITKDEGGHWVISGGGGTWTSTGGEPCPVLGTQTSGESTVTIVEFGCVPVDLPPCCIDCGCCVDNDAYMEGSYSNTTVFTFDQADHPTWPPPPWTATWSAGLYIPVNANPPAAGCGWRVGYISNSPDPLTRYGYTNISWSVVDGLGNPLPDASLLMGLFLLPGGTGWDFNDVGAEVHLPDFGMVIGTGTGVTLAGDCRTVSASWTNDDGGDPATQTSSKTLSMTLHSGNCCRGMTHTGSEICMEGTPDTDGSCLIGP